MFRKTVFLCLVLLSSLAAGAQQDSFSVRELSSLRIRTTRTGMQVLGAWGAANIVGGIAGRLAADDPQWQRFHQMNALWGIVNLGIAGMGYLGARKEAAAAYSGADALHRYEAVKRLFLLNAGLDGLYIGTGVYLAERAHREVRHPDAFRGYGHSLILQGAGLLLFDVVMFAAHHRQDARWYRLLQGLGPAPGGIGFRYSF